MTYVHHEWLGRWPYPWKRCNASVLEGEGPPEPRNSRLARRLALQIQPIYLGSAMNCIFYEVLRARRPRPVQTLHRGAYSAKRSRGAAFDFVRPRPYNPSDPWVRKAPFPRSMRCAVGPFSRSYLAPWFLLVLLVSSPAPRDILARDGKMAESLKKRFGVDHLEDLKVKHLEKLSVPELGWLIREFQDQYMEQYFRAKVMRELGKRDSRKAATYLLPLLGDPFVHIREVAVGVFEKMKSDEAVQVLCRTGLGARDAAVRRNAAKALGRLRRSEAVESLMRALSDRDATVGVATARALARIGDATAAPAITRRLSRLKPAVKGETLRALGVLNALPPDAEMEKHLRDAHWEVKVGAIDGAAASRHVSTPAWAKAGLADRSYRMRIASVEALAALGPVGGQALSSALEGVERSLKDDDWRVRAAGIHVTPEIWDIGCITLLVEGMAREQATGGGRLLIDYGRALRLFTGKTIGYNATLWEAWWRAQKTKFRIGKKPERNRYGVLEWEGGEDAEKSDSVVTFYSLPVMSKRAAFVFDFSGSMGNKASEETEKTKIEIAKAKMLETLAKFDRNQWFNILIYRYKSEYPPDPKVERAFPAKLMPADRIRKHNAEDFLLTTEPKGWGCFYEALTEALAIPDVNTIYFLSDGKPSRGRYVYQENLIEALRRETRFQRVMIHTVLTGEKGTDERFMKNLAAVTWGLSTKG